MGEQESKLSNYIDYPYDRFLKLRIEFLILTQSDLKARIMRLIERCVENERANVYRNECNRPCNKNKKVEIPDGIFAAISHKFFMDEMWGTVQSETTVRDALKELETDHLIIRRPGGSGPYDPPLYTLNKPLIEYLFNLLPALNEIDMLTLMKPPRKKKLEDGTINPGTIIDPLAKLIRGTITGPLDPQLLDPYPPIIGPLSRSRGVQLLDPKRYTETLEENKREESIGSDEHNVSISLSTLSREELEAELARRNIPVSQTPLLEDVSATTHKQPEAQPTQKSTAKKTPAVPKTPKTKSTENEIAAMEVRRQVYAQLVDRLGQEPDDPKTERLWIKNLCDAGYTHERIEQAYTILFQIAKRRGSVSDKPVAERTCVKKLCDAGHTPTQIDRHHAWHATDDWHFKKTPSFITASVIFDNWNAVEAALSMPGGDTQAEKPSEKTSYIAEAIQRQADLNRLKSAQSVDVDDMDDITPNELAKYHRQRQLMAADAQ